MERDDLIVNDSYSLNATHDEAHGKAIRKKIFFVTALLSAITAFEVCLGIFIKQSSEMWPVVKWGFIVMTLIKAGYIVMVFMHLGDERKTMRNVILIPYAIFVAYLIVVALNEGTAINAVWQQFGA